MINITLGELVNNTEGLRGLSQKQLKARCAYAVGKILKAADAEMATFNDARMDLIKKYGEKDDKGELKTDEKGNVHIPENVLQTFSQELTELLKSNIEINASKIKMSDLESVEFTPSEMSQLESFIELEEEE